VTPRVVILSAPSGGGKTTISQTLREGRGDVGYSVSATTRAPRAGEVDGRDYHFVSRPEFDRLVAAGEFLEWAEYAGNRYGTLRQEVEAVLRSGRHVLLDIEVQGARQVWARIGDPPPIRIFILPPSGKGWIERLVARETESRDSLARRADWAAGEIRQALDWEHIIVNDRLERAVAEVSEIIDEGGERPHQPPLHELVKLVEDLVSEADRLRNNR
jgi:guanylate kinase